MKLLAFSTALTTALTLAPAVHGVEIRYNLNNVIFSGIEDNGITGNITGYFSFNADTNEYSDINIQVTGTSGASPINRYDFAFNDTHLVSSSNQLELSLQSGDVFVQQEAYRELYLGFFDSLTGQPNQNVILNVSTVTRGLPEGGDPWVSIGVTGSVQAVPFESDVLPLLGATVLFGGGVWLKRRRALAQANLDLTMVEPSQESSVSR